MTEIMEVQVGNPRSTACLVKGDFDIPNWLFFVQEDPLGVQSSLLPYLSEDPMYFWGHG
jgi:hypothetical protein